MSGPRPNKHGNPWEEGGGNRPVDVATESAEIVEAVITSVFGCLGWLARHPVVLLLLANMGLVWWFGGWVPLVGLVAAVLALAMAWRWWCPVSFERRAWRHMRAGLLKLFVYGPRWARWARASNLVLYQEAAGEPVIPHIKSVRSGTSWDEVRVRMLPGQTQQDYEDVAESLAQSRKVARCAVREVSPGVVSLGFLRRDPLNSPVPLPEVADSGHDMDLKAVHIGQTEHGEHWYVPCFGSHLFGAGMTGSGKGSLMWGPIRQLAPAIACGRAEIAMIDPKGGMEGDVGEGLYASYARDDPDEIVELLTARVDRMNDRKHEVRGQMRKVEPTTDYPLEVTVIDELAAVTKYLGDKKKTAEVERLLGLLLTQGRALGYVVWGFVQEPTKEAVPFRGLFPYRVALRLDTPNHVDMVLGEGAWQRGAWADRIGPSTPGVGYVVAEGIREPLRVRAAYTSDHEIQRLARDYAPNSQ